MQMIDNTKVVSDEEISLKKENLMYICIKRLFDFLSAFIGLILLSPVFVILILLVKLDSKGPAMFGHKRLGKNGKTIKVYKFRTMVANADEVFANFTEEQKKEFAINFKLDNDPRITRIGNFLRKTSLDELPQLLNILLGDMSVVGPRPIVEKEVEKYGKFAPKFFSVTPGLTGYWQAHGRSDTTYEERIAMDMYYIDNRSLILDMKIIAKTFVSVIKKEGAI
ncbi:sugar transferase [Clostridium manihotivorum]|uniref:Exopolysaccharide biosynthesis protein n=1 Tax=Clostridium manihotivorum TaxID=2320868 RepID=A0A3R5QXM4_9CLOT|nr:sugar transferase [Clostridium manihotivorum]QAA34704.1 exopolysaccharide biosynthesis protein [Clostridium manihotivorum]